MAPSLRLAIGAGLAGAVLAVPTARAVPLPGVPGAAPLAAAPHQAEVAEGSSHHPCGAWGAYGRVPARTFDADCPSAISPETVASLLPVWSFKTPATVTASPAVVDGRVFVGDWSATMFALDADTGRELWRFAAQTAAGAPFGPIVASPAVARSGARQLVVFGSGPTMHAVDAETGAEVWSTYVGSATPETHPADEETQFEASPVVWDGVVYSGLDVHNRTTEENHGVRGGVLAFDLASGELLGWFDPEHDFVDASTGDRLSGCSSVWSSPTLDVDERLLYFATGNCPHDLPPGTGWGRHIEAVTAIDLDPGTWHDPLAAVRWTYTPDPRNRDDTDFGATPNLFEDRSGRKILGIGKKDAVYYALDPATGELVWSTRVTEPGNVRDDFAVGGFIGSTATGRGMVFGGTAIGFSPPFFHALDGATGEVLWSGTAGPSYSASAHVNGVVLAGALDDTLKAFDARTGGLLWASPLLGPISSGPAIVGDRVFVGSGTSSSDLCAKDAPGSDACFIVFDEILGATGGVHAFELRAPGHRAAVGGVGTGEVLLANEGNRTWIHDLDTLERRVLVRAAGDAPPGATSGAGFRDVSGQVCADPTRPGHYVAGESYFRLTGSSFDDLSAAPVGTLAPVRPGAPRGCGFLSDGRLVTATGDAGAPDGRLAVWFPPFDRGSVPSCTVDATLATAGGVMVDHEDRVYVAVSGPDGAGGLGGILRFSGDLPRSVDACTATDPTGAPAVSPGAVQREMFIASGPTALTPSAIVASGTGTFYVSSLASGTIAEYDRHGVFIRFVLLPSGLPARSTGTPHGMAVGRDGTLYYADPATVGGGAGSASGTVRRVRFTSDGRPLPPETLHAGIDLPDGVGFVPAPGQ